MKEMAAFFWRIFKIFPRKRKAHPVEMSRLFVLDQYLLTDRTTDDTPPSREVNLVILDTTRHHGLRLNNIGQYF